MAFSVWLLLYEDTLKANHANALILIVILITLACIFLVWGLRPFLFNYLNGVAENWKFTHEMAKEKTSVFDSTIHIKNIESYIFDRAKKRFGHYPILIANRKATLQELEGALCSTLLNGTNPTKKSEVRKVIEALRAIAFDWKYVAYGQEDEKVLGFQKYGDWLTYFQVFLKRVGVRVRTRSHFKART